MARTSPALAMAAQKFQWWTRIRHCIHVDGLNTMARRPAYRDAADKSLTMQTKPRLVSTTEAMRNKVKGVCATTYNTSPTL